MSRDWIIAVAAVLAICTATLQTCDEPLSCASPSVALTCPPPD